MARELTAKDKLYYISRATGIPKNCLAPCLMEPATTLRKWSYNHNNVSDKTRKRIEKKLLYMSLLDIYVSEAADRNGRLTEFFEKRPNHLQGVASKIYSVSIKNKKFLTVDFIYLIQLALTVEMGDPTVLWEKFKSKEDYNKYISKSELLRIFYDTNLEIEEGRLNWPTNRSVN